MKKLLYTFLAVSIILSACKKEDCNCGDYTGRDFSTETSMEEYAVKVINDCTNNTETFIVDFDTYSYINQNDRYCRGMW